MFRGIVLAVVLLVVADRCFNDSALTVATINKLLSFAAATRETVGNSVYRGG